jgi:hypothetical protein
MVKNLARSRYGLASAHVVFPLPTEGLKPEPIGISEWQAKPVDERAPARSVALVDVIGHRFVALVIDTVHGRELWLITGHTNRLSKLYDGMQIEDRERHTLVISSPLRDVFVHPVFDAAPSASEDHCESQLVTKEVHTGYPSGGSPGLVVTASVVSDVVTGLDDAQSTQLGGSNAIDVQP